MLGLTATSEIRKIVVCGFMLFTTDIEKKHIYFHISSGKTLGAPFANSNLGFTVFFSHSRSFFHPSILCLNYFVISFFLSLCFTQTHRIASFYTTRNIKAKISQSRPNRCSTKRFPPHLTKKKIETLQRVLRIWVTTASVMSFPRVTIYTCFLLKPFRRSTT